MAPKPKSINRYGITLVPKVIDHIIELVIFRSPEFMAMQKTLSTDQVRKLGYLSLIDKHWNSRSRRFLARYLMAGAGKYHDEKLLRLVGRDASSTLASCCSSFHLEMTGYDDVVDCVIGFFWRKHLNHREWDMKVSPHRERFQRSMHPFLQFISSPGPLGGSTIGNHLFNCVETLSIAAVPFPYFLFPKEIDVLAKAFPNLVSLHLVKTWCFHQLSHAVNFLASFVLLENLVVGPLMLSDDDEDAAWASLEEVACSTLPHLRAVQFNDTLSPYNLIVLLRLTPLHALERATMAIKGCTVRAWNKSGEGWRRLAMFLRTLNNLHLDVTGEPRDVLSIVDLRGCERLTSLKLFTGSGIDLKWMLSRQIPSTKLERLMIGSDLYPKGLAEIDEVVSRYPCLKELYYAHRLPSDSDIEGLADSELNTLRSYFPLCIARGVNVESGSYKIQ